MNTLDNPNQISFIDLAEQLARNRINIDKAIARVLDHGHFILGPEVQELERKLAYFCKARYCITCANGTDAISLLLMAVGIGPGDAVFVPSFTFAATAEVVAGIGATPIFIDSNIDTFNMDAKSLLHGIDLACAQGLLPRAVIPVDLFGLPADYDSINAIASENNLLIFCDAAQSFGANYNGRRVGSIGHATTTSFFPAKPLGCYGDGGAIFTNDDELAHVIESLRVHGKGNDKYENIRIGLNSRLDTIQAAILLEKLQIFENEIESRNNIASNYTDAISDYFVTPKVPFDTLSVWAQYTLRVAPQQRSNLMTFLGSRGVPSAIYYPRPLHTQIAYQNYPRASSILPVAEQLANEVISLPMHPYLSVQSQKFIINAMLEWADSI